MGCGWDVGNPARGFFHLLPGTAGKSFPLHAHRDGITQGCWGAGPRSCPPALAAGKPSPGCSGEQCCECPHVPPCGQGSPYQPITAPPPAMLYLPSHLPSSWGVQCSQLSVIAQCPSRQSMGEDVLMVAWVRCVLAACTPRGSDGISALIHSPPSSPSHQGDVDLSPCGCPC